MRTILLEDQILDNNKMARMILAMAEGRNMSTYKLNHLKTWVDEAIIIPDDTMDFEAVIRFQSEKLLTLLSLYNEYTAEHSDVVRRVEEIKSSRGEMAEIEGQQSILKKMNQICKIKAENINCLILLVLIKNKVYCLT